MVGCRTCSFFLPAVLCRVTSLHLCLCILLIYTTMHSYADYTDVTLGPESDSSCPLIKQPVMPRFCGIPIELLYLILFLLDPLDLPRLSRTCKLFHQLATPRLWRSYHNYNQRPYNSFLRAVLTNPTLAEHIQEVHTSNISEDDPHEISQENIQLFQKAVADTSLPVQLKNSLKNGIKEAMADPMLALLLCNLPNLKTLFMVNPDDWSLARDLFDHADSDNELSGFKNLHRFSIETEDIETGIAACSEFGSVFNMVKGVQIVHINDIDMSPSKMQPCSSPIEHLHIIEGEMGPEAVRVFIQSCRTLLTFNYTYGKIDVFEEHFRPLEAVRLLLGCHRDTLEELTMLYDDDCIKQLWYDLSAREWYMGTELRCFTKLKTLRSGMHSLLGLLQPHSEAMEQYRTKSGVETPDLVDVLPGSLERLTILYADERIAPHLRRVAEVRAWQFPNLEKVVIGLCQEAMDRNVELRMEGVELTMLYQSKSGRAAYVYDRERFSWLGPPVFRN